MIFYLCNKPYKVLCRNNFEKYEAKFKNTLRKHIYREYINGNNFDFNNFVIRQKQGTNCMSSISLFIKKITKPKPNPKHGGEKM